MTFVLLSDNKIVFDSDRTEKRESTRHKFRTVYLWDRTNHSHTNDKKRAIPPNAIEEAVKAIREQINFED